LTAMPTRKVGSLDVSVVGLGCNNFGRRTDEKSGIEVVKAAMDVGITFFDTADIYGGTRSEEVLGKALRGKRSEVIIATKFGMAIDELRQGARPAYVIKALEDSLRRLGTDYIDLYQLHQPDPATPIAETLAVLDRAVEEGKVREIGCSNFSAAQLREAHETALSQGLHRFVSLQNEYSILHREPEADVLPECERLGIAFVPFYPLFAGVLSGKYRAGEAPPAGTRLAGYSAERRKYLLSERNLAAVDRLDAFARERGHGVLELAIAWLLARRVVASVIAGATRPEQVHANARAAGWKLSAANLAEVDRIAPPPWTGSLHRPS